MKLLAASLLASVLAATAAESPASRPFTVQDLNNLETVGIAGNSATFSKDGRGMIFSVQRPRRMDREPRPAFLAWGWKRDVWLIGETETVPRALTFGASDGSGFWSPLWSPDGQRIALLSNRGGRTQLWLWEKSTNGLRPLIKQELEPLTSMSAQSQRVLWVDNTHVLCAVLPENEISASADNWRAPAVAMQAWPKAWAGRETTASVVDSGVPVNATDRPQGSLLLADVVSGAQTLVDRGNFHRLVLSPDKSRAVIVKQGGVREPEPQRPLVQLLTSATWRLGLCTTQGAVLPTTQLAAIVDVLPDSIQWSPDGKRLAFMGTKSLADDSRYEIYLYELAGDRLEALRTDKIQPIGELGYRNSRPRFFWSSQNDFVVLAGGKSENENANPDRPSWWQVSPQGKWQNLTADLKAVPATLFREDESNGLVGVADGSLWRIFSDGRAPTIVTTPPAVRIAALAWPSAEKADPLGNAIVVEAREGRERQFYAVNLKTGSAKALPKPSKDARLLDYFPANETAVFSASNRTGSFLWRVSVAASPAKTETLVETNTFLREVAEGTTQLISYTSLNGQPLKATLLLPSDYQARKKYPLVTFVYPGTVFDQEPDSQTALNSPSFLNLQLLAARGYAVLCPSMPLASYGVASDIYMDMTNGVLPAVDKAVEMGVADPQRLAVMGHSFGGYGTYALITQTNRFKAAVALAGPSDLISSYGIFDANARYTAFPQEELTQMMIEEGGPMRLGSPPWKDLGRYLRNSPTTYVDRVQTPVMIVQGDLDYVAVQQGEEFFSSLYRQGKRAKFVRYWGEGHVIGSPANIEDLWNRIFYWLDTYIGSKSGGPMAAEPKPNIPIPIAR